jgi:hypothetical protein
VFDHVVNYCMPGPSELGRNMRTNMKLFTLFVLLAAVVMSEIPSQVRFSTFEIKKVSNIQLHSVRYEFEDMVCSKLAAIAATMFTSFTLSPTGVVQYRRLLQPDFISAWLRVFPGVMKDGVMENLRNQYMDENTVFQLDMCASLAQNTSLSALMKDVVEFDADVFDFNERGPWKDIPLVTGDVVMFEFCEDVTKLPTKVFQVERALQLRESCISSMPMPKAVGVVFNGERSQYLEVVQGLTKSSWPNRLSAPKVFGLPVFLIYSSYINIFGEVRKVSDKVDKVFDKVDKVFKEMRNLLLHNSDKSQLIRMCRMKGIQLQKKATVDDMIMLLTREE